MTEPVGRSRVFRSESVGESLRAYLPATLLSKAVGLLRGLLLPWLMALGDYGLLNIAILVVNLLTPVCSAGLNDAVQRYVPHHEARGTLRRFLGIVLPLVLIVSAALSASVFAAARPVGEFLFQVLRTDGATSPAPAGLTRLAALTAFVLVIFFLVAAILKGLRMYRAIGLMELTSNALFAGLAVAFCVAGWNSPRAVVSSYALAVMAMIAIVALPLPRVIRRIEQARPPGPQAARGPGTSTAVRAGRVVLQMLRFSLWAALAAATWQVLLLLPFWYLYKVAGAQVAAVFAAVQVLAQGMVIVANAIVTVVETAVTRIWEAQGPARADRQLQVAYKSAALLLLALGVAVAALAPVVIRLLPREYSGGAAILPLLVLFYLLAGHLLFMGIHFHLIERTRHLFVPWLAGVLAHVVFSVWLVRSTECVDLGRRAALAGIGGMTIALAGALVLALVERRPIDRGMLLLILAAYGLAGGAFWVAPLVLLAALIAAGATGLVFTPAEKDMLRDRAAAWRRSIAARGARRPAR